MRHRALPLLARLEECSPPTNAGAGPCVLDMWEAISGHQACSLSVARLLLAQPGLVETLCDLNAAEELLRSLIRDALAQGALQQPHLGQWFQGLAKVLSLAGRTAELDELCRDAIAMIETMQKSSRRDAITVYDQLAPLFRECGRLEEAQALRHLLQTEDLLTRRDESSLFQLRGVAFDAFTAGDYATAERIYRHLVAGNDFEPANSRCHLARVLVATGQDAEAREQAQCAWGFRAGAEPYVVGRIIYLQALMTVLAGENPTVYLSELKTLLMNGSAHNDWTMAPVLRAVEGRLRPEANRLFAALVGALGSRSRMAQLEALPEWQAITAVPIAAAS